MDSMARDNSSRKDSPGPCPGGGSGGNSNCLICRDLRVVPFARCRGCNLPGLAACRTVALVVGLLSLCVATGVAAWWIGGPIMRTGSILAWLGGCIALMRIGARPASNLASESPQPRPQIDLVAQHEFLKELSPIGELQACLNHIVRTAARRLRAGRVSIMLPDAGGKHLYIAASVGVPGEVVRTTRIPVGERICGSVFQRGQAVHYRDASDASADLPIDSKAFVSAPLLVSGLQWANAPVGVLSVTEPVGRDDFSDDDQLVLAQICEAAAVVVCNQLATARSERTNVELLETLANAIEARDGYTRGHSERVSRLAIAVGQRLGLPGESLGHLHLAARLHDIGKIATPDAILNKVEPLTEAEWNIIRRHPTDGVEMLAGASLVAPALDAIRQHHERWDGMGYPLGAEGEQIPLLARIIAVADSYDAMTSARPYRAPLDASEAVRELAAGRGKQFDPRCVDAMLTVLPSLARDRTHSPVRQSV
jgi:putative nucleotidyltransferase with HDIG domain